MNTTCCPERPQFFRRQHEARAWLTDDHAVQRTRFANGVEVTANFGEAPYALADGMSLALLACRVDGLQAE